MTETLNPGRGTLLAELDARQNEVLEQLDALNDRLEKVLRDWAASESTEQVLGGSPAAATDDAVAARSAAA